MNNKFILKKIITMGNNKSLYRLVSGTAEINRDETNHND